MYKPMNKIIGTTIVALLWLLASVLQPTQSTIIVAQSATPSPNTAGDDSVVNFRCTTGDFATACASGVQTITAIATSENSIYQESLFPNPTVALLSIANYLNGSQDQFVTNAGQILGYFTEPLFPGPGQARINLPIVPGAAGVDLDNNDSENSGVQVYALLVAANLIGDSYLQQLEQGSGLSSIIQDVATGAIIEGTFLLFAPDDAQGFPANFGADGLWFTADDPTITLPAGYTVATISADGTVTLDRSPDVTISTIERAEAKALDFSEMTILDSFNALIDTLKVRYAYTELRNLDWEAIRASYLPAVEMADADNDAPSYYLLLDELAKSLNDTHVSATTYEIDSVVAKAVKFSEQAGGSLGARTFASYNDTDEILGDRILVLTVGEETPAAEIGWVPGTEIVSINGEPAAARLDDAWTFRSYGTENGRRKAQAETLLFFPMSTTVTIGYRLPDASEVLTATMMTGAYSDGFAPPATPNFAPITYEEIDGYAIIRWSSFMDFLTPKIAVLEEALAIERNRETRGVILDLRGNGGGWSVLYETMASYFFTAEDPMPVHVFDWYYYDQTTGKHIPVFAQDFSLHAPNPEDAYTGPLVILVDDSCASACEYFSQHLQLLGRATVIGQYTTAGAGGFIDQIAMPGSVIFQYTQGETTFAGTEEPNLEAKGVVPDVRVPVTLETEEAKLRGEDPVMIAAVDFLIEHADRLTGTTWQWRSTVTAQGEETPINMPENYGIAFAEDGTVTIQADCNLAGGTYTREEPASLSIELGPVTIAACPEGSYSEDFLTYMGKSTSYAFEGDNLFIILESDSEVFALAFDLVE